MSKTKVERYSGVYPSYVQRKTRAKISTKIKILKSSGIASDTSNTTVQFPNKLMLSDDTEPLDNQVAGHMSGHGKSVGMFKHKDGYILKPIMKPSRGEREMSFYEELQSTTDPILQELRNFVPTYHGTKVISINGNDVTCMMLDNITKNLKEPCIIDIKIGRRTWDPLASTLKIQKETKKYIETKQSLGFCIPGFHVRNISDGQLYKYGKEYGRTLDGETIKDALKLFLNADSGLCRPLLVQLLGLLWRILHWCRRQRKIRLYSSSLLLVYDARLVRHFLQNSKAVSLLRNPVATDQLNNELKRNRTPSLCDTATKQACNTHTSGQFTSEAATFERLSENTAQLSSPNNINCAWKNSLKHLQKTHSLSNNYEEELQNLKQNYAYMLDDLVDDGSNLWANVKMIDFAHAFSAENNTLDTNYLLGIENLIKIFESFLQESI